MNKIIGKGGRVYLDYAASTPVDRRVLEAMLPYFSVAFGNAGSLHAYGQEAMAALDKSREIVAGAIGAKFNEIIFTSSATEANNLALRGAVSKLQSANYKLPMRIVISAIEHESILETAKDMERGGIEVVYLPVNKSGVVDTVALREALSESVVLVSIMYANNEIGTIQPIQEIAKIIREYKERNGYGPLLHTDAVQAVNYLDCDVNNLHVDMMTLSSHKIYGPKGTGCLYVRFPRVPLGASKGNPWMGPMMTGGGQEFGYRSSTENIPAIVGFAKAMELVNQARDKDSKRISELRDYLGTEIKNIFPKVSVNGGANNRLVNNLNIHIPGVKAEELLIRLDLAGVSASSGSACRSRALDASYVIKALGYNDERAKNSLRFTLGRFTTKAEINKLTKILKTVL